jgi:hypothetical protein
MNGSNGLMIWMCVAVTCKAPGSGKTVDSMIYMGYNLSLIPESLVSIRLSNARNINSPDTRGLGFPFVKVKFDDRIVKSVAATEVCGGAVTCMVCMVCWISSWLMACRVQVNKTCCDWFLVLVDSA